MEHNWDYYFGFVGQADYYRPVITEGVRGKYTPAKLYEGQYVDTLLTEKAVAWLKQERTKPFCLFLWFYAPHAPFYRPKDMVNDFNGVPIPKPATFDEDQKGYPGKPRGVAEADNKIGYSEVFNDDPRSLEELVKDHYAGVQDNDRNVGAIWQELEAPEDHRQHGHPPQLRPRLLPRRTPFLRQAPDIRTLDSRADDVALSRQGQAPRD